MLRRLLLSIIAVSISLAIPVYAIENDQTTVEDQNQSIEQKKSEALKHIDERIEKLQQQKTCINAAQSNDDMKSCWKKFKEDFKETSHKMKHHNKMDSQNNSNTK